MSSLHFERLNFIQSEVKSTFKCIVEFCDGYQEEIINKRNFKYVKPITDDALNYDAQDKARLKVRKVTDKGEI